MKIRTKVALYGLSLPWLLLCISIANEPRVSGISYVLMGIAPFAVLIGLELLQAKRQEGAKAALMDMLAMQEGQGYLHARGGSGIAVNPASRLVALVDGSNRKAYPFADIREWEAVQETAGEIRHNSVAMQLGSTAKNIEMAVNAARNTGFFVTVRDIDHPVWRVEMPDKADQRKWMEILRQQINETPVVIA